MRESGGIAKWKISVTFVFIQQVLSSVRMLNKWKIKRNGNEKTFTTSEIKLFHVLYTSWAVRWVLSKNLIVCQGIIYWKAFQFFFSSFLFNDFARIHSIFIAYFKRPPFFPSQNSLSFSSYIILHLTS